MKSVTNHVQKCMKIKPKIGTPVKVKEFDWKRNSRSETTFRLIFILNFVTMLLGCMKFICYEELRYKIEGRKIIPDICHERHEYIRVNFFWPV